MRTTGTSHRVLLAAAPKPVVRGWASAGLPSRWPYGLEKLADHLPAAELVMAGEGAPRRVPRVVLAWHEQLLARTPARFLSRFTFSGVIWLTDEWRWRRHPALRRLERSALGSATGLWCLAGPQVDRVRELLGSRCPPVEWIPFGIDESFFTPQPYYDSKLIVSAGNDPDRDLATTYAAITRIRRADPAVRAVIQARSSTPPPPGVTVVPNLSHDELKKLYARAAVVLVCTRDNWHVSGMTVALEASSMGRPVVATGTPGFEDYIIDGVTGLLAPVGDVDGVADRLRHLVSDPTEAEKIGAAGSSFVRKARTTGRMCEAIGSMIATHL